MIILIDSDHHGDDYVTLIVVNVNKILVLDLSTTNQEVFCQSQHPLHGFDWSAQKSQVTHLHNSQTITMGII